MRIEHNVQSIEQEHGIVSLRVSFGKRRIIEVEWLSMKWRVDEATRHKKPHLGGWSNLAKFDTELEAICFVMNLIEEEKSHV